MIEKRKQRLYVGMKDRKGHIITSVDPESGWYKTSDGATRDPDGFEWFGDNFGTKQEGEASAILQPDEISGGKMVIRDFKIRVNPLLSVQPKDFIKHYMPTIEATMVETGWDYANVNDPITFGEAEDGYVHIHVKMTKKAWKNKENIYSGGKQGQSGDFKSPALIKANAVSPVIKGVIETERSVQDILNKK